MLTCTRTFLIAAVLLAGCGGRTETEPSLGEGPEGGTTSSGDGNSPTDDGGGSGGSDASESEGGATTCPPVSDLEYTYCDGYWRGPSLKEPACTQRCTDGASCPAALDRYMCFECSDAGVLSSCLCDDNGPNRMWYVSVQPWTCVP